MKKDYYESLGVSKDATDAEIKSAFRKLAKKYHPDNKETGDEAKFKEVGEAYAVLSDPDKRKRYDQFGSAGVDGSQGGGFGDFGGGFDPGDINLDDILKDFFGGGFGGNFSGFGGSSSRRGSDIKISVPLTFMEAAFGCEKDLELDLNVTCDKCHGTGGFDEETCSTCGGRGRVIQEQQTIFGVVQTQHTCPKCHGKGRSYKTECSECHGKGIVRKNKTISVTIPEGVDNGYQLRLPGKGEAGRDGGSAGDIYLEFNVKDHPIFKRDGKDIYFDLPLSITDAILGCKKEIPTLNGNVYLDIKAGTQNDTKYKLKGKGIKIPHAILKGDMYAVCKIIMPEKLNREQKDLLNTLAQTNLEDNDTFKEFNKYLEKENR